MAVVVTVVKANTSEDLDTDITAALVALSITTLAAFDISVVFEKGEFVAFIYS